MSEAEALDALTEAVEKADIHNATWQGTTVEIVAHLRDHPEQAAALGIDSRCRSTNRLERCTLIAGHIGDHLSRTPENPWTLSWPTSLDDAHYGLRP